MNGKWASVLTSSGSLRPAKMLPFSLGFCLLGLFSLGEVSSGGGGGGGGGATLSLVGEIVSSNQRPKMGSLSSSRGGTKGKLIHRSPFDCCIDTQRTHYIFVMWLCHFQTGASLQHCGHEQNAGLIHFSTCSNLQWVTIRLKTTIEFHWGQHYCQY